MDQNKHPSGGDSRVEIGTGPGTIASPPSSSLSAPKSKVSVDNGSLDSEVYMVEAIKGRRTTAGKLEYLVKWQDYPETDNTWEPAANLMCWDLIHEFKQKQNQIEGKTHAAVKTVAQKPLKKSPIEAPAPSPIKIKKEQNTAGPSRPKKQTTTEATKPKKTVINVDEDVEVNGFDRGLKVDRIYGASCRDDGEVYFVVHFAGENSAEVIRRDVCNVKCPYKVIQFYEERMIWYPPHLSDNAIREPRT